MLTAQEVVARLKVAIVFEIHSRSRGGLRPIVRGKAPEFDFSEPRDGLYLIERPAGAKRD